MPGHDQEKLEAAHIALIGCGGLGSWIGLGLVRAGVKRLMLIDHDRFDRTNAPRQFMHSQDIGVFKAPALARNLRAHMTNRGEIRAIAKPFSEALFADLADATALVVGVDNNRARLTAASFGLHCRVPVIYAMISKDGMRIQAFLQRPGHACLRCVLPDVDPESGAPCAAASMASCLLASSHAVCLTMAAVMDIASVPTWRESSLNGETERAERPPVRNDCSLCACPWLSPWATAPAAAGSA